MRRRVMVLAAAGMLAMVPTATLARDHAIDEAAEPRFLSVVSAASGSFDGDSLILEDVPAVLYFSDRPARIAGHLGLSDFVGDWDEGADSFAADPPNATLSILGGDETVVEFTSVARDFDTLTFGVVVIDGSLPDAFGPASLFIDDSCGLICDGAE